MKLLLGMIVILTSGCSSFGDILGAGIFENRLSCSLMGDQAYLVSKYGPVGISTDIHKGDSLVACTAKTDSLRVENAVIEKSRMERAIRNNILFGR